MFFAAHLGDETSTASWRRVVDDHAAWLNLGSHVGRRRVGDGRIFSFAWVCPPGWSPDGLLREDGVRLHLETARGWAADRQVERRDVADEARREADPEGIGVDVEMSTGKLEAIVPPATTEQLYYHAGEHGITLANDLRLMLLCAPVVLDEMAVNALLRYGSVPPPLTISRSVRRVCDGHVLRVVSTGRPPELIPYFTLGKPIGVDAAPDELERHVEAVLDDVLARLPDAPVLLFSGGSDSGLLAARLRQLDRDDVRLLNLRYGPHDPEAVHAQAVAAALGLRLSHVDFQPSRAIEVLTRLGKEYSFPFGDTAAIGWTQMIHSAAAGLARAGGVVIGGEGGDESFASAANYAYRWDGIYALPLVVRWTVAAAYRAGKLWKRGDWVQQIDGLAKANGRKGRQPGVLAPGMLYRSVRMPQHAAGAACHSLDEIAFHVPPGIRAEVDRHLWARAEVMAAALERHDQYAWNRVVTLAEIHSAKSFDPLRRMGVRFARPFLHARVLRATFAIPWTLKADATDRRAFQKRLLAHTLPPRLVFRPKGTPNPPIEHILREVFAHSLTQEVLQDVVLAPDNPVGGMFRRRVVAEMVEHARRGRALSTGASNFLWTLAFLSCWLQQVGPRGRPVRHAAATGP